MSKHMETLRRWLACSWATTIGILIGYYNNAGWLVYFVVPFIGVIVFNLILDLGRSDWGDEE